MNNNGGKKTRGNEPYRTSRGGVKQTSYQSGPYYQQEYHQPSRGSRHNRNGGGFLTSPYPYSHNGRGGWEMNFNNHAIYDYNSQMLYGYPNPNSNPGISGLLGSQPTSYYYTSGGPHPISPHIPIMSPMNAHHFCKYCRRPLHMCNFNPCEKMIQKMNSNANKTSPGNSPKQTWIRKDEVGSPSSDTSSPPSKRYIDQKNNDFNLEDSFSRMNIQPSANSNNYLSSSSSFGNSNGKPKFSRIPKYLHNYLIGKVHNVCLKEYSHLGMIVQFTQLPTKEEIEKGFNNRSPLFKNRVDSNLEKDKDMIIGLVQWSVFPKEVQDMSLEERLKFSKERIPIGSTFYVYVNGIEYDRDMILTLAIKPNPILNLTKEELFNSNGKSKYRYLIIVDLEATCDFSPSPVVDSTSAEIIEFPWVVLDTETLEFKYEKQVYIKPDNLIGMTPYCRVLTGITTEEVKSGCSLAEGIEIFNNFVMNTFPEDSYRILTDGVWDLQFQLREEALRKKIPLAKWFKEYFDLKEEFRKFLPWFPFRQSEPSLHTMLRALNLDFVGKHHSGIDDCYSIAQIVGIMIKKGHKFDNPTLIPDEYDPLKDPSYFNFTSFAPPDSWICPVCTSQFCGSIWNRPLVNRCRFCSTPRNAPSFDQDKM